MRLKSGIWAAALTRRAFSDGHFAAIERRGAEEAGAIFVRVRHRDGLETVFGPAPQALVADDENTGERFFETRLERVEAAEAAALLEREKRFDPDLWIIELEVDAPQDYLTIMLA